MKKLFFAALFAIVAVGGALSANAKLIPVFDATGKEYDCSVGDLQCDDQQYYTDPNAQNPIDVSDLYRLD
jgi:hypothetical protein